jgi:hypothetical protein
VAGTDKGAFSEGFTDNFTYGTISVGGGAPGMLRLVDLFDSLNRNGPAGAAEALYIHDLAVGNGSTLDLNGLHVYYDGTFVKQGTILGGWPIFVPEPATLSLLALGGAAMMRRRKKN